MQNAKIKMQNDNVKFKKIHLLREKHPRFIYESFEIKPYKNTLDVQFHFTLEPDIHFAPSIIIPLPVNLQTKEIEQLVFHVGLVEMISYWKAAISPEIIIRAGVLTAEQIEWWKDLFAHGLGEFYYINKIDFTEKDFLKITSDSEKVFINADKRDFLMQSTLSEVEGLGMTKEQENSKTLSLVGGGKDSAVTLEILKEVNTSNGVLLLNPTPAGLKMVEVAGIQNPIIVKRTIDPQLLELNKQGYLNGHTPFSAYLGFLSILVAQIYGFDEVVVANERSANEGSLDYFGMSINHQYSKSFRFESRFRKYVKTYLTDIHYFSLLRPLYDVQAGALFSTLLQYFSVFISCNRNQGASWCGKCSKCVFAYLILFPFLSESEVIGIFGEDLFAKKENLQFVRELTGLDKSKPFDCVGTYEESILAVGLAWEKVQTENRKFGKTLEQIVNELDLKKEDIETFKTKMKGDWNNEHFVPDKYAKVLRNRLNWLKID